MIGGATIKRTRIKLRETQQEFAKRFDVDQGTVCRWEKNGLPQRGAKQARQAVEGLIRELSATAQA